jgi:hypothetical protein
MTSLSWRCCAALLLLATPSLASPPPGRVVVIDEGMAGVPELEPVAGQVTAVVRGAGFKVLGPDKVRSTLERDAALAARRQRAEERLAQATTLVNNVRYDEALIKLAAAERAAMAGLAGIVAPRLLAEIHLQRGLALLATDPVAAERWLVMSFRIWPRRALDPADHAPRILQALRSAARAARATGTGRRMQATEAGRVARVVPARLIFAVHAQVDRATRRVRVAVRRFDTEQSAWSGAITVDWFSDATAAEVRGALRPVVGLLPSDTAEGGGSRPQRTAAWVLFGASAVGLATGIGLTVHAASQIDEARSLANRRPLVEYSPQVRELEDSAVRSRTGAIVAYSLGGAALVAAVVLFLRSGPRRSEARVVLAPGGAGVALSWP